MHPFFKSFQYAYKGIRHGFLTERNFRFHVLAIVVVSIAGILTGTICDRMVHYLYPLRRDDRFGIDEYGN